MGQKLTAVINKEDAWYVAHCIELGVVSQGNTIEEGEVVGTSYITPVKQKVEK